MTIRLLVSNKGFPTIWDGSIKGGVLGYLCSWMIYRGDHPFDGLHGWFIQNSHSFLRGNSCFKWSPGPTIEVLLKCDTFAFFSAWPSLYRYPVKLVNKKRIDRKRRSCTKLFIHSVDDPNMLPFLMEFLIAYWLNPIFHAELIISLVFHHHCE